jgi:hypothetical protein
MSGLNLFRGLGFFGLLTTTIAACSSSSPSASSGPSAIDAGTDAGATHVGIPDVHYATAPSCRTTRPAGPFGSSSDAGTVDAGPIAPGCTAADTNCCTTDADCASGKNGRCGVGFNHLPFPTCSYDDCFTDSDCAAGKACVCDDGNGDTLDSSNVCVPAGCRIDSDCGAGGYCSPSFALAFCNGEDGFTGAYCHTRNDECTNNEDCAQHPGTEFPAVYCAFSADVSKWICASSTCAG